MITDDNCGKGNKISTITYNDTYKIANQIDYNLLKTIIVSWIYGLFFEEFVEYGMIFFFLMNGDYIVDSYKRNFDVWRIIQLRYNGQINYVFGSG